MPVSRAPELPEQKPLSDLLSPFGYVHCWGNSPFGGGLTVEMTLICDPSQPPETFAAAQAYAFGQAGKILAALEADGRKVYAVSVTVSGIPVEATMRIEAGAPNAG